MRLNVELRDWVNSTSFKGRMLQSTGTYLQLLPHMCTCTTCMSSLRTPRGRV